MKISAVLEEMGGMVVCSQLRGEQLRYIREPGLKATMSSGSKLYMQIEVAQFFDKTKNVEDASARQISR
jgi:hypothetical protein